jgi:S1-C subfamily serine protease
VVEAVDGKQVDAANQLQSAVAMHRPGDVVSLRVWRNGEVRTLDVELMGENTPVFQNWLSDQRARPQPGPVPDDERPQSPPESTEGPVAELDAWGVGLRPVEEEEQSRFGLNAGAYVAYVEKGQPADEAGLPRDVVITALDDVAVETPDDVQAYLQETDGPVLVQVQRKDGSQAFYEID